jgi:hypothetical protein
MNKNFVIIALLIALVSVVIYSIPLVQTNKYSHVSALYETDVQTQVKHNGIWGPIVDQGHNTVPNIGLNWTMDKLFATNTVSGTPTVIALGNNTNAEVTTLANINMTTNNSAIVDCGLAPATISGANLTRLSTSTANVSLSYIFINTCANAVIVNTTALYNQTGNGTSNTMFAGKNFAASVTLQNNDQLNVTWYVWVTSG